jgi:hypothetical protein
MGGGKFCWPNADSTHETYKSMGITYCVEQSPSWSAGSRSAKKEIPLHRPIWNWQVYQSAHCSMPLDFILIQINTVHIFTSYFYKLRIDVIVPSTYRYLKCPLPSGFPRVCVHLALPMRAICLAHLIFLGFSTRIFKEIRPKFEILSNIL